jgi:hypothetical protein
MNRFAVFVLMGLMSPCIVAAQGVLPQAGATTTGASFSTNVPSGMNCPISLRARPASGVNVVVVKHPQKVPVPFQQLHLIFGNWQSQEIVAASVIIRGFDSTPRLLLGADNFQGSSALAKAVDLKLNVAKGKKAERDVTLESFATISRVDLESVEYADGTSWKASPQQKCHIMPDRLLLVGAH